MKSKERTITLIVYLALALTIIGGGVAIGVTRSSSFTPTPTPTLVPTAIPTSTPIPEGSFIYNGILLGENESTDYDGDYISDRIEYRELGTDPLAIYTNGNPIDDFNAVYTYGLNPLDSAEISDFMSGIPNVEAKIWAAPGQNEHIIGGVILWEKEIIEIGMRDPVVKYYASQVSINWQDSNHDIGTLELNGQPLWIRSGDANYGVSDSVGISWYFTHGREGICGPVSMAHVAALNLMGYECKCLWGIVENGTGHVWAEVVIDGSTYIVRYNLIERADQFYQNHSWTIEGFVSFQ